MVPSETILTETKPQEYVVPPSPDISHIAIEDDQPVDSLYSEKLQRLLTTALYASFHPGVPFLATANVGLFYGVHLPPLVPDVMVSLDVTPPATFDRKENRTYFVWEMGKPPDVVIEIVSNRKGQELDRKLRDYARAGVSYYVVYDPLRQLRELEDRVLVIFEREGIVFRPYNATWIPAVGLGLTLWRGVYEGVEVEWLRWCDQAGNLLLTGQERAELERQRAEAAQERAELERQRAESYLQLLRQHGITPPDSP